LLLANTNDKPNRRRNPAAQGFVMPNDNMKYPFQFQSYAGLMSPLYLNSVPNGHSSGFYVNNAKIVASYLIQIDQDNYQTLHLIDEPLEFAYVNRRAQLRAHQQAASALSAGAANQAAARQQFASGLSAHQAAALVGSPASMGPKQFASVKRPLQLDDLLNPHSDELSEQTKSAILEFSERFGDLITGQPQADLYRVRSLSSSSSASSAPATWPRLSQLNSRDQLQFDQLTRLITSSTAANTAGEQEATLRGKLYNVSESNSFGTYFLPISNDQLSQLLEGKGASNLQDIDLALQAHIIPDQVLFTRTMTLGQLYPTLFNRAGQQQQQQQSAHSQQVSLGLAKALPANLNQASDELSRRLAASPLLLQAKCEPVAATAGDDAGQRFMNGLTQAEIVLANIPISNGVLHLIRRPILVQSTNLLDYINDNEHQLSNFVQALGSHSGPYKLDQERPERPIELNKFRELLTQDRQLLASFSNEFVHSNRTLLAPADEAFAKLRYDLRALVFKDELLIPSHWDLSYRQDLLRRLIERHIVPDLTITSDIVLRRPQSVQAVASQGGQLLSFKLAGGGGSADDQTIEVDCGQSRGRIVHQDLIGTNGVLHVVDRVLGEEQETVHSLLSSLVIGYTARVRQAAGSDGASPLGPMDELRELIEQELRQLAAAQSAAGEPGHSDGPNSISQQQFDEQRQQPGQQQSADQRKQQVSPELAAISKSFGQYLDGLSPARRQLLAASVNISFHLAKLVSRLEGGDDWNEKFQRPERAFTYFVPNDLAWLRLQQRQPELYKPLAYFLDQQAAAGGQPQQQAEEQQQALVVAGQQPQQPTAAASPMPRSSESSHRLLQVS
jgi:uncharacterized surface protein with fasciclin (FAS1) repeats